MRVSVWRPAVISLHRLLAGCSGRVSRQAAMSTAAVEDKIVVPAKINRSPTDILKALAGTVGQDTSGPHYKYHDDPYLTPCSNLTKRSYALSKESGRKAARWVRDQHPQLFTHRPEDPFVEGFYPKTEYKEEEGEGSSGGSDVSVDTLTQLVGRGQVSDAITVYHLCGKKGLEVPEEVRQAFLEMLCFYNAEGPLEPTWVEERWFRQVTPTVRKTWKDQGLAEEVFAGLPNKGPPAYCAIIRGMAQYYQVDRAWQLYQECRERGVAVDTATYNALIRVASLLRDAADLRWQLVKELLGAMAESGTRPDLGTLNAALEALTQVGGWRQARDLSLQVLTEFQGQGVEPSLASFYYLLTIHCRERGPVSHILLDILDHSEGRCFSIQHPIDTHFFVTAMQTARVHLESMEAARRVDDLLHHGDNHLLIGDSYKESVYYRHYLALSCTALPFEEVMEGVYRRLVPHLYTPEPGVMQEVLQALQVSGSLHYLPQLWSDLILFDLALREKLMALTLSALALHHPAPAPVEDGLTESLATVAKDMWLRVQEQPLDRRNRVMWTGQMLGELLEVLVRLGDYTTAKEVLGEAATAPETILGYLPCQPLHTLLGAAIEKGDAKTAVSAVLYGQDAGHMEAGHMAIQVRASLQLTPQQRAQITSLLGHDTPLPPPAETPAPTPGT